MIKQSFGELLTLPESKEPRQKALYETPWVEKYRPKAISEIVSQNEAVDLLKRVIITKELPNLIFYGPPGTGKTTTALALARELFKEKFFSRVLELNASDERGIQVIREKVKKFAQGCIPQNQTSIDGSVLPPYKLIILDEADSLTISAQAALRRSMEVYTSTSRFCIICNYITRLIDPLLSRCSKYLFNSLPVDLVYERVSAIAMKENMKISEESCRLMIEIAEGDMRRCLNMLQSLRMFAGDQEEISSNLVRQTCGFLPDDLIDSFVKMVLTGGTDSYEQLMIYSQDFVASGFSLLYFMKQFLARLTQSMEFSDKSKSLLMLKISELETNVNDGGSDYVQLLSLGSYAISNCSL